MLAAANRPAPKSQLKMGQPGRRDGKGRAIIFFIFSTHGKRWLKVIFGRATINPESKSFCIGARYANWPVGNMRELTGRPMRQDLRFLFPFPSLPPLRSVCKHASLCAWVIWLLRKLRSNARD